MAAVMATCHGCGDPFAAARRHARWCSDRCRKRHVRADVTDWPEGFADGEEALYRLVRDGRRKPEDALLLLVRAWPTKVAA